MDIVCDIIIPIYNAFDATIECVNSVLKNTDLTKNSLMLINDCSTDKRISGFINSVRAQNPQLNIYVIENKTNRGFVGTVNIGMKKSNHDVLLLNSDTIVSDDWLNRIKKCAYSQPKVGTVTAMSNNATLASVPKGLTKNEIPDDITINEYNQILFECAYCDYPELPTAHGFCMYIRREALDKLGFFDEASFGKGYGEENDFSFRCMDYGFKNLLCDDVIVYHLENQSFSHEREKVIESHLEILKKRYPDYSKGVDDWCKALPIGYICKNIDYNLNLRKKKNVLVIIHEWDNAMGGTTLHVKDIISSLNRLFNFHILFPSGDRYVVESHFGKEVLRTTMPFVVSHTSKYNRYSSIYKKMVDFIIRAYAIGCVHIHHLKGHFFDIADITQSYGIDMVVTLHDFYSLCPSINMLYCDKTYCENIINKNCASCLIKTGRASNNIVPEWQSDWHNFLKKADKVIVPSRDTRSRLECIFNDIEITVIEHGVDIPKTAVKATLDGKLKVAFIGVICRHKGGDMIKALINENERKKIEFHTFGKSEYKELTKSKANYKYHGAYRRENLNKLLWENKINIICFLQIWPETYSYTVDEAVSAGIPVLSLDMGAGAKRIKDNNLGWVLPHTATASDILKKLLSIKKDAAEYNRVVKTVRNYRFKSVSQMAEEYRVIYSGTKEKRYPDCKALKYLIKAEKQFCVMGSGIGYDASKDILNEILSSAKWRIVSKIKIPKFISRPLKFGFRLVKRLWVK